MVVSVGWLLSVVTAGRPSSHIRPQCEDEGEAATQADICLAEFSFFKLLLSLLFCLEGRGVGGGG